MEPGPLILSAEWDAYSLVDCGGRRKLERFGENLLVRSEPKAWWHPDPGVSDWSRFDAESEEAAGKWNIHGNPPRRWLMKYDQLTFEARLTNGSKHVGIFPEQEPHWRWLQQQLQGFKRARVLNLFGYTGAATLVAAAAGAEVTHVDASKPSINWARHNQELSGLSDAPVRWILDDAFKFVAREVRRKRVYDVVLLDPPSFGRGPRGELWKVEQQITHLLDNIRKLLSGKDSIVILTMYNLEASSLMLKCLMEDTFPGGQLEYGELALSCSQSSRMLPLSLFARWRA